MKRVLLVPTLILILLGIVCYFVSAGPFSAADHSAAERPIVFCSLDDIKTIDPGVMTYASDIRVAMGLWEGLAVYDKQTLAPRPAVASSWDVSDDKKTYTFHLRGDARWSNGDPVTAHDFLFAWKRVLTPSTSAQYIELFYLIQGAQAYAEALAGKADADFSTVGISAPDARTLVVRLKSPCTYFLDLVAFPPYYPLNEKTMRAFLADPQHPLEGYKAQWTHPPNLVSNGPYQLKAWKFQQYLQLEPNVQYWDRQNVKCPKLLVTTIRDGRAALLAYQSGAVDVLSFVPQELGEDLLAAQARGQWPDLHYRPVFGSYYFNINCGRPPLNDKRVRKALALAVDRQEIVDKITRMHQRPLGLLVPPDSIPGYVSPSGLESNVAEAQKLLAEAGYPEGRGLRSLELLYNNEAPVHGQIAQTIAQMWKRNLGVSTTFRALERGSYSNARNEHDYDISRGGWYGDYPDPTTWLDLLRSTDGNNDGQFKDPDYDKLLDEAAAEADPPKRFAILARAEALLVHDELPFIPLYQYGDGYVVNENKIQGAEVNVRLITQFKWIRRAQE